MDQFYNLTEYTQKANYLMFMICCLTLLAFHDDRQQYISGHFY